MTLAFRSGRLSRALLPAALAALAALPAAAQTSWNFATPYAATEFQSEGMQMFADTVTEKTGGALEIVTHHGGSLFPNPEILQATRDGLANMGSQIMANLGRENPLWELDGVPFLVTSYPAARKLWETAREPLSKELAKTGLRLLYSVAWPPQGFYFNKRIESLADVKGMRIRAYNPATTRLVELMGGVPVTIQIAEAPQAFATGVIDAMNTSAATGAVISIWDSAKYYYKVDAWQPNQMVFVREADFQALTPEQQEIVLTTAKQVEDWGWARSEALSTEAEQTLVKNGMELVVPSPALKAEFDAIGDTMLTEWIAKAGPEGAAIVEALKK